MSQTESPSTFTISPITWSQYQQLAGISLPEPAVAHPIMAARRLDLTIDQQSTPDLLALARSTSDTPVWMISGPAQIVAVVPASEESIDSLDQALINWSQTLTQAGALGLIAVANGVIPPESATSPKSSDA
ncbi:MAG: hypothetical protein LBL92_04415 [Propionibacteriaceae bacterium]|jgi:hypothetical protein|nr:hypothetical protein [Propionibacteriaceae bacterium]